MTNYLRISTFLGSLIMVCAAHAIAQSTIFNVPSADVVSKDHFFIEGDFATHAAKLSNGGFQGYSIRGAYGFARNFEAGANFSITRSSSGRAIELQPNIKWKAYTNEKFGVGASGGAVLFVPLNKTAGTRTIGMAYANISKVIKPAKNLKVTTGAYTLIGAKKESGSRAGAMIGIEQPLHKRANLIADWYSGKNRFGYATIGAGVFITKNQTLYAGYSFGNSGRGNNFMAIYYGFSY